MKILVTGGAGFIGTNLCKKLLKLGHDVISVDNYSTGKKENHIDGVTYLEGDITGFPQSVGTVGNKLYTPQLGYVELDIIFHMAAIARIQPSFEQPKKYFKTNANGTLEIADYCVKNNIPLIYAGSSSHHSGKFKNPYTFTKDIGEDVIKLYEKHFGLKSSIVRFYNVYGPHQLLEGGYTTLIGRWINNIQNNIQCEIYGDGEQRRDFTHVDDIVDGLIMIMEKQAYGYNFELGKGKNYSVNEIAEMFGIDVVYKPSKPGEARHTLNTDSTAAEVIGWFARRNIEDYIKSLKVLE